MNKGNKSEKKENYLHSYLNYIFLLLISVFVFLTHLYFITEYFNRKKNKNCNSNEPPTTYETDKQWKKKENLCASYGALIPHIKIFEPFTIHKKTVKRNSLYTYMVFCAPTLTQFLASYTHTHTPNFIHHTKILHGSKTEHCLVALSNGWSCLSLLCHNEGA